LAAESARGPEDLGERGAGFGAADFFAGEGLVWVRAV
jgi:hypothetical protein